MKTVENMATKQQSTVAKADAPHEKYFRYHSAVIPVGLGTDRQQVNPDKQAESKHVHMNAWVLSISLLYHACMTNTSLISYVHDICQALLHA